MFRVVFLALFLALTCVVSGQDSCFNVLSSGCYYTGAATVVPDNTATNRYFAIGGLFNLHSEGQNAYSCGTTALSSGIANLQAFFWAIDYYKKFYLRDDNKDMSVGAVVFDNCMRTDQTIENLLGFSQCKLQVQSLSRDNVVAFVGPYGNNDAMRTGMLASDLNMGLLSPSANSLSLSKTEQDTLLRFRPSIKYDLEAIVAFLQSVNSKYAMIFYSDDPYWMAAYKELNMMLTAKNICPAFTKSVTANSITQAVTELQGLESAKYVIPLMNAANVGSMMGAIGNLQDQIKAQDLIFIFTSEIGNDKSLMTANNIVAQNGIVVNLDVPLDVGSAMSEFNKYLENMQKNATSFVNAGLNIQQHPWRQEIISGMPKLEAGSVTYLTVVRTIMSVKAIIKGMDQLISNTCGVGNSYQFCDALKKPDAYDSRFEAIRNALDIFDTSTNQLLAEKVHYNYYRINNINVNAAEFSLIGTFVASSKKADLSVNLNNTFAYLAPRCPSSLGDCCRAPVQSTTPAASTTEQTTMSTQDPMTGKIMVFYPEGQAITGAYSDKHRPDDEYGTRFDLGQKWIISLSVLAGLGILFVIIFEIYILYKLLGTHMGNKWRTMWLGQLLLLGIFLCYLVLFAYIFIPTKATCGIIRFGVGVSYAICFAVLLVKLMVILTSKNTDVLLAGEVESSNYLKGVYQVLMFLFAVGVQVVIDAQWLITVPPEAVQVRTASGDMVWVCNHYTWEAGRNMTDMSGFIRTNFENHVLSLVYIMVLMLITTILSLNAHGIITNHRESVFIGIAAGFSIPIWLAWTLVGGLNKDNDFAHEYGDACIAFGLLLTATLILFTMFLPKVRQLVNMGVEGIYLEDDRDTYYAGSVIMSPPSYKSKGPSSVIYVNNQGIYSEPVVIGNGDPSATHLKHPGSTYSAPPTYLKKSDSTYGGSRVLKVTDDLKGRHPSKRGPQSEAAYISAGRPRSMKGTLPRSRSQSDLGAL